MNEARNDRTDQNVKFRERLTPEAYAVTREAATEPAYTGRYWDEKRPGTYVCVCCETPLFASDTKFDSGTGWPSFTAPLSSSCVTERRDTSYGMIRTEVVCTTCDAHLGHVFPDGPPPNRQRHCLNSLALVLHPADGSTPDIPA